MKRPANLPAFSEQCASSAADTTALERAMDQRVSRLYALTPAEIKLVEEGAT